jgi:glycosyltransferase involved in cell wall biosynthesis
MLGHDVVAWSAASELRDLNGASLHRARAEALASAARKLGPFDLIDAPASDLVSLESASSIRVARSVQPVLDYLEVEVWSALRRMPLRPSTWRSLVGSRSERNRTIRGLITSDRVVALGSIEFATLSRRLPGIVPKLSVYFAAPPFGDRDGLRRVRVRREAEVGVGPHLRFLWIGRWTAHKGVDRLLDWMESGDLERWGSQVTIAGCGEARDRRVSRLVRRGVVEVIPRFRRAELPDLLERHDAGLFTSSVEGWGLGLQEMLESGLPVYAVEAGAVPDLRPWLAPLLRPFPPPSRPASTDPAAIDWEAYEERFSWTRIAREYIAAVQPAGRGER